jgi:uncharacterized protein (DUF433 family)
MPTRDRVVSIVVDREPHRRMQAEATRRRKSVSRFVRDLLAERLLPQRRQADSRNTLLRLCGLAHGELSQVDVDEELSTERSGATSRRDELDLRPPAVPNSVRMPGPDRIAIDASVMLGKPAIRGTRITVELILRKLSGGATEADLLDAYPQLTRPDIRAAVAFAADTIAHQETLVIEPGRRRARR